LVFHKRLFRRGRWKQRSRNPRSRFWLRT
jgi:hypothetical protein